MKLIISFIKHNYLLILVIFIAGFLRLYKLGIVPVSMSDDEIREVMSAFSFWHTGRDLFGMQYPFSFNLDGYVYAPIPLYIVSPFVGIFGLTMFMGRLPYALAGILSIICIYYIIKYLVENKYIAFFSAFMLSISAWHLQISRFSHQGVFSLMFLVLGVLSFLHSSKRNTRLILLSMFFFFLSFYSYSATKAVLVPAIMVLLWYKRSELKRNHYMLIFGSILFIIFSFLILGKLQNAAQYSGGQFFFQDVQKAAFDVELERRASSAPDFLERLYHNKLTYWSSIFLDHYLYAFSSQYLFLSQEGSGIYSLWFRGQLYLIELPMLFLGGLYLFVKKKKVFVFTLLMLLVSPLPSAIGVGTPTYTQRSIFMLPWLALFVGGGVYSLSFFVKKKKIRFFLYLIILACYVLAFGRYLTQYYYDWSRYGAKYYSKSTRDIAEYIRDNKSGYDEVLMSGINTNIFLHYAFYSNMDIETVQKKLMLNDLNYENIKFISPCIGEAKGDPRRLMKENSLYIAPYTCFKTAKRDGVITTFDKTENFWAIYKK